jgi:glycosyltransferase involved in cell wall biosynthesis
VKIILSNYRYFISGGPERYLFSVKKLLSDSGHKVIPFSIKNKNNENTYWEKYFVSPVDEKESVYFEEYDFKSSTIIKILERSFYSREVYHRAKDIAKKTRPDIVYILHFLNKMSPSLLNAFKDEGIPVIIRLSDFNMVCPEGHFLSHGNICEACIKGDFYHAVINKCIKNSYVGSLIKCMAWYFHRMIKVYDKIDAIICPTKFTKSKMIKAGFPENKLHIIPTYIDAKLTRPRFKVGKYLLFFGRSTKEKGMELLIEEYIKITKPKPVLKIITNTKDIKQKNIDGIKFIPFQTDRNNLFNYIKRAMFVIVPSICYENLPNAILESFLCGKPVIASNLGSIPEIVKDNLNGRLFNPLIKDDLKNKIEELMYDKDKIKRMGEQARSHILNNYDKDKHYYKLFKLFRLCSK